jgi:hypothetical protein
MVNYVGRTEQQLDAKNFLGINSKSSVIAGTVGEALDIQNWDIDFSGATTRRLGQEVYTNIHRVSSFWAKTCFTDTYFLSDGSQVKLLLDSNGTVSLYCKKYTNPGTVYIGMDLLTGDWMQLDLPSFYWGVGAAIGETVGASLNGRYYLANGISAPVVIVDGGSFSAWTATDMKTASLLSPPSNLSGISPSGSGTTQHQYMVTATTVRGETLPSQITTVSGPAILSASSPIYLTFVPPTGAYGINVYKYNSADAAFHKITSASLAGTSTMFVDDGSYAFDLFSYPPTANTSYNTPADWETNGYPQGFFVLSRGKAQRLMAWRGSSVWCCALNNPLDWYTPGDAFSFNVQGGMDNNVTGVATLLDYTVVFSRTNSYVYTGSTSSDFSLAKIQATGCPAHYATTNVGDEVFVWGQHGPTTLKRVITGADIEAVSLSVKVSDYVFQQSNKEYWGTIKSWHDINNQRVLWAYPSTNSTIADTVLAFNYNTQGWTRFSNWSVKSVFLDPVTQEVSGVDWLSGKNTDGTIVYFHKGYDDAGIPISDYYSTIYYDMRTFTKKRMPFIDIIMDAERSYNVSMTVKYDWGLKSYSETHTLTYDGTTATTDGGIEAETSDQANLHRVFTLGDRRTFNLTFVDNSNTIPARILGWRADCRVRGTR